MYTYLKSCEMVKAICKMYSSLLKTRKISIIPWYFKEIMETADKIKYLYFQISKKKLAEHLMRKENGYETELVSTKDGSTEKINKEK